jgi:hypothetical protein
MSRDKARLHDDWDNDEDAPSESYVPTMRPRRSQRTGVPPADAPQYRRKKRGVWPWLLAGCAGGVILLVLAAAIIVFTAIRTATNGGSITAVINPANYTRQSQQQLSLASIAQIQIHNPIGNVTVTVDPNATITTITSVKKVKAASSEDANNQFNNMSVQVQPAGTPDTTLSVSATVPDNGGIFSTHNDSIDLTIVIPQASVNPTATTSSNTTPITTTPGIIPAATPLGAINRAPTLNLDMSIGGVMVNGLHGVLNITDDVGSITVDHAVMFDGSHLRTGTGNVTFNGSVDTTPSTGNTTPRYKLQSETGNVDVTLPGDTNIILDANTNAGTITSDFPINVTTTGGSASYYGPLLSGSTPNPAVAVLTLNVSTGSVHIHRG